MKHVYTLDDLRNPTTLNEGLDKRIKLAVIGDPIKHSASPEMHQAALLANGEDISYIRIHVPAGEVDTALKLMEDAGFIGCNVTIPHKAHFTNSQRIGHNTDGPGLSAAIFESFNKPLGEMNILLLGAGGGAGRAIATQCASEGCPSITLSNRTKSKIENMQGFLTKTSPSTEVTIIDNSLDALSHAAASADLIINSTSLGLNKDDSLPIPAEALRADHYIYDAQRQQTVSACWSTKEHSHTKCGWTTKQT